MNIIVCIDKENGMMFGGRRQSQDRVLREHLIKQINGAKLWMNSYSAKQFTDYTDVCVAEDFLEQAAPGDYCFIEDAPVPSDGIEKVLVYHWNRRYPADKHFSFDLKQNGFKSKGKEDFAGSSHEKITFEVFER